MFVHKSNVASSVALYARPCILYTSVVIFVGARIARPKITNQRCGYKIDVTSIFDIINAHQIPRNAEGGVPYTQINTVGHRVQRRSGMEARPYIRKYFCVNQVHTLTKNTAYDIIN